MDTQRETHELEMADTPLHFQGRSKIKHLDDAITYFSAKTTLSSSATFDNQWRRSVF